MKKRKSHSKKSVSNVTLVRLRRAIFYCFLCGQQLPVKTDKNQKLYFICNPCGLQAFVRGAQGRKNLETLIEILRKHDFAVRDHTEELHRIQGILAEVRGIEKEIESLDDTLEMFESKRRTKDKARMRKLLTTRIDTLLSELELIARAEAQSA